MTVRDLLRLGGWGGFALLCTPVFAQTGDAPLSAIDWLSESVEMPVITAPANPILNEAPIADSVFTPDVTVTSLDSPSLEAVGILPSSATGLPRSLWSASDSDTLAVLIAAQRVDALPAMQDLLRTLLLAEADPPLASAADGQLFLARVDKLLDIGALEPAQALLERADSEAPPVFRRLFDVALLTGHEDFVCDLMRDRPDIAPTLPARIFCLARSGDWAAAALTLNTARALGDVSDEDAALMERFLDPDLFEGGPLLNTPATITPLVFRMREAIGEAIPTAGLPRAFAHADLRTTTGWKAQLDASERLVRSGAITPNQLLAVYSANRRAASGGVWDRVDALQSFETALEGGDEGAISTRLPAAWDAMQMAHSEVAFATLFAAPLNEITLTGRAAEITFALGLLSEDYETYARAAQITSPDMRFLRAVATGDFNGVTPRGPLERAIAAGFGTAQAPQTLTDLVEAGKLGETILRAIALFNVGSHGDLGEVTDALALLRAVGLEDTARRASLQLILLERRT